MAAGKEVCIVIREKFERHKNTMLFIQKANNFMVTHKVPDNVRALFMLALGHADGIDHVILVVNQLMEIMHEYESAAVAMRFSRGLPPDLINQLQDQMNGLKESTYRWAREVCADMGIDDIDEELEAVKKWLGWMNKQPNKSQIELECQALVEHMRAIPADQFSS
jgi:hypothetical protein